MVSIFQDPSKKMPKSDGQIIRVGMEEAQIAGRKDHMPRADKSVNAISHIPNVGSKT